MNKGILLSAVFGGLGHNSPDCSAASDNHQHHHNTHGDVLDFGDHGVNALPAMQIPSLPHETQDFNVNPHSTLSGSLAQQGCGSSTLPHPPEPVPHTYDPFSPLGDSVETRHVGTEGPNGGPNPDPDKVFLFGTEGENGGPNPEPDKVLAFGTEGENGGPNPDPDRTLEDAQPFAARLLQSLRL